MTRNRIITLAAAMLGIAGFSLAHSYRGAEMEVLPDPSTVVEVKLCKNYNKSNFDLAMVRDFFENGTNLGSLASAELDKVVADFAVERNFDLEVLSPVSGGMIIDRAYNLYSFELINPHFLWLCDYQEHGVVSRSTTIFLENPNTPLEVSGLPFSEFLKKRKADRAAQ